MGLDQYLTVKTKTLKKTGCTGACGGLIPLAPVSEGPTEIGYWRKAYLFSNYMRKLFHKEHEDWNCESNKVTAEMIDKIIVYAGKKIIINPQNEEEEWESNNWGKTYNVFTKAQEILKTDPKAEFYYMEWY